MSKAWPDREQALLRRYVAELDLDREGPRAGKPYESVLRRFQMFVMERSAQGSLDRKMVEAWLRECVKRSTLYMAVRRAQIVSGFLDWLVRGGYLAANPFAEIRCVCRRQSTAAIVRALVSPDPELALEQPSRPSSLREPSRAHHPGPRETHEDARAPLSREPVPALR